jgi:hypothetical protein
MKRVVLSYGFIAGGILAATMALAMAFQDQIGFDKGAIVGYTSMVVAFLMVFFGVRAYRENAGGAVSFGRAFGVGLAIVAIASCCYVATWEAIYWKFMPDFGDKYAAYELAKARKEGKSDAQIAATQKEMDQFREMYQNPMVNVAFTFLEPLPVGVVFTLVAAGVLRRRQAAG